jgi:predicted amidohydrolase
MNSLFAMPLQRLSGNFIARRIGPLAILGIWTLSSIASFPGSAGAQEIPRPTVHQTTSRTDRLPRKVLLGTVICGEKHFSLPLEKRLQRMDELVEAAAAKARADYPGKRLDLVVLPEAFLARPGDTMAQESVRLADVLPRIAACARTHGCYLVAPLLMQEADMPLRYSNAAVIVDRIGGLTGIYRKVHPVAAQGSDDLEGGTTPGGDYPVFDCDFGRLGIQICFDMFYPDGWKSLARQGAEIIALPSASPETVRPAYYAFRNHYYVVSAAPRDHAAVYSPLGMIEAQVTNESVLVHQIDLSYAILHWESVLEEGQALKRRFGDRVGFYYYHEEDNGLFWSNDPEMTIGQMIGSLNLTESDANAERVRVLQDKARGGPPKMP